MHFRKKKPRNDGSSKKRRQRDDVIFKRLDNRRERYEGRRVVREEA